MNYTYLDPRRHYLPIIGAIFFWIYSNKFLTYSVDYVTQMSRDLSFGGVQQNIAYYSIESLILLVGGFLLISYLLVQNEFSNLFNEPRKFENPPTIVTDLIQNMYLWIGFFGLLSVFAACWDHVLPLQHGEIRFRWLVFMIRFMRILCVFCLGFAVDQVMIRWKNVI